MGYELLDHTGDIGIKIWADDLKSLFREAALALFDIITDLGRVEVRETREIVVEGMGYEELLVAWLSELHYLQEVEGLLFRDFTVITIDNEKMKGLAGGEVFREDYHIINTTLKAVTYHQLEVKKENDKWLASVIFDI